MAYLEGKIKGMPGTGEVLVKLNLFCLLFGCVCLEFCSTLNIAFLEKYVEMRACHPFYHLFFVGVASKKKEKKKSATMTGDKINTTVH